MTQMAVLRTGYVPWRHLDNFNQILGAEIPRHESNLTRPGLLARNYLHFDGEDGSGVLQAYQTPRNRGFKVGFAYPKGMEEKHSEIKKVAARLRKATRETTGKRIRTTYIDLPLPKPKDGERSPEELFNQEYAYAFSALGLTS